jgi:uncharacterized protein YegP (UPF0339 family)
MKRPKFIVNTAADGRPYWVLVAANGEILCTSETYESGEMARKGIRAARRAARFAPVIDRDEGKR